MSVLDSDNKYFCPEKVKKMIASLGLNIEL